MPPELDDPEPVARAAATEEEEDEDEELAVVEELVAGGGGVDEVEVKVTVVGGSVDLTTDGAVVITDVVAGVDAIVEVGVEDGDSLEVADEVGVEDMEDIEGGREVVPDRDEELKPDEMAVGDRPVVEPEHSLISRKTLETGKACRNYVLVEFGIVVEAIIRAGEGDYVKVSRLVLSWLQLQCSRRGRAEISEERCVAG